MQSKKIDKSNLLKLLLLIGGAITVVYLITKARKKDGKSNPQGNVLTNPTNAPLEVSVVKPTLTDSKIRSNINRLVKAFSGNGTDEEEVYNVFTDVQNDADFNNLLSQFGTRKIPGGFFNDSYKGSLRGIVKNEMSVSEIKYLNSILEGNGVSKKFTY
jgi:hypothetical protein